MVKFADECFISHLVRRRRWQELQEEEVVADEKEDED